jgi:hypothetical protein
MEMTSEIKNTKPSQYQYVSVLEKRRETKMERSDERDTFQVFKKLWSRECKRISVMSIDTMFNEKTIPKSRSNVIERSVS